MPARPADFAFRYAWREGSLPPPHHYEFTIVVDAGGRGTIVFYPDYLEEGVAPWEEAFLVPPAEMDELYRLMAEAGYRRPEQGASC